MSGGRRAKSGELTLQRRETHPAIVLCLSDWRARSRGCRIGNPAHYDVSVRTSAALRTSHTSQRAAGHRRQGGARKLELSRPRDRAMHADGRFAPLSKEPEVMIWPGITHSHRRIDDREEGSTTMQMHSSQTGLHLQDILIRLRTRANPS